MTVLDALLRACTPLNLRAIMDGTNHLCIGKHDADKVRRAGFHRWLDFLVSPVPVQDTLLPSPLITGYDAWQYDIPRSLFSFQAAGSS
jgi:hypothetical protein